MEFSRGLQESLVAILCYRDGSQGASAVAALVPVSLFDPFYKAIAKEAVDYISRYEHAPGSHTLEIFEQLKSRRPKDAGVFDQIFTSLVETNEVINADYVFEQAATFVRGQRMRDGIGECLDYLDNDNVDEAASILQKSLESSHSLFDPGTRFDDVEKSLAFLHEDHKAFECGIPELDVYGLGPAKGRLHIFAAPPAGGKSWWLIHCARHLTYRKTRVLYVTLELAEPDVMQRFAQSVFGMTKRHEKVLKQNFKQGENGTSFEIESREIQSRLTLTDERIEATLKARVKKYHGARNFYVKNFPTASLTVRELEAYLDVLEASEGFIPEVILVDYADIMKVDEANYRHSVAGIYRDLRGLAQKRHVAVATASQINRGGSQAQTSGGADIAESYDKVATADVLITYNQTGAEHKRGLARLFVAKGRTDRDKFSVIISQSYANGQFCRDSAMMPGSAYWNEVEKTPDE